MVSYGGGVNEHGNGTSKAKNWIGRQWDYEPELYPSGGEAFVSKLGNLSMTYYTNGFDSENAYSDKYKMVGRGEVEPHPTESYRFYSDLIANAVKRYNMEMLFTDFLCYRGPTMQGLNKDQSVPRDEEAGHMWLAGMSNAAGDNGVEVQYCMALAHQILESAEFPAVTNARVSGDGGLNVGAGMLPSLLASIVGLGWSKDNLRTATKCFVPGLYPNGTGKSGAMRTLAPHTHRFAPHRTAHCYSFDASVAHELTANVRALPQWNGRAVQVTKAKVPLASLRCRSSRQCSLRFP